MRHLAQLKFLFVFMALIAACSQSPKTKPNSRITSDSNDQQVALPSTEEETKPIVLIVSGFDSDPTPEQIAGSSLRGQGNSGTYQLMSDLKKSDIECQFFNWNGTEAGQTKQKPPPGSEAVKSWLRRKVESDRNAKIIVVCHSWGAHTVMDLLSSVDEKDRMRIPLMFLLDASSAMRGARPKQLPTNVDQAVNYFTNNAFCWKEWKDEPRMENISLGDPGNGYLYQGGPKYDAVFDIGAHNAAEWDQRIHQDICRRILANVKEKKSE